MPKLFSFKTFKKTLKIFLLVLLAGYIFISFFKPVEMEDIWWHMATGKWIIEHKAVPHEDIFSYTDVPVKGISPQWLGSVIYYLVYSVGGLFGLQIFRVIILTIIFLIFFVQAYKKLPFALLYLLSFLLLR